ncbi:MAG TPA: hypothetical protein VFT66_01375 [Roseiflexaceae bacterium]|nr:hypothetical protein [Roseiflexaceae bacterium]
MSEPFISSARATPARSLAWRAALLPILAGFGIAALMLYAYRDVWSRPFVADDYQWLLGVRGLSFRQVVARAFDVSAQSHFYRPLVWLLFWAQTTLFGLDARPFHMVSMALHALNAGLLGWLAWRLGVNRWGALLAAAIVALHPAPFEAVVWVSAQSELLAAALLLIMAHVWVAGRRTTDETNAGRRAQSAERRATITVSSCHLVILSPIHPLARSLLATLALALALLAKESAVIGLPLLVLLGSHGNRRGAARFLPYVLPTLLTVAYLWLQRSIEARNYLLQNGGYGIGIHMLLNPLRSLALVFVPLPGTEHADAPMLVWIGAVVAALLLVLFIMGNGGTRRLIAALLLTLLPTAPFVSPPDSRYIYEPVLVAALLLAVVSQRRMTNAERRMPSTLRGAVVLCSVFLVLGAGWFAVGEVHAREERWSAASGPGGSLWRLAQDVCSADKPKRFMVVDPPVAPPHVEAIVRLACGAKTEPLIVGRAQVEAKLKNRTVVVGFPNGSAEVEQRRP